MEEQQNGLERAKYGKEVLKILSMRLNEEFEKGFSVSTLTNIRKFYLTYSDRISEPVVTKFANEKSQPVVTKLMKEQPFELPWTHYMILMRIENEDARRFYEITGAEIVGRDWVVPDCATRPLDGKVKSGEYKKLEK